MSAPAEPELKSSRNAFAGISYVWPVPIPALVVLLAVAWLDVESLATLVGGAVSFDTLVSGGRKPQPETTAFLKTAVEAGLRARLTTASILTGAGSWSNCRTLRLPPLPKPTGPIRLCPAWRRISPTLRRQRRAFSAG